MDMTDELIKDAEIILAYSTKGGPPRMLWGHTIVMLSAGAPLHPRRCVVAMLAPEEIDALAERIEQVKFEGTIMEFDEKKDYLPKFIDRMKAAARSEAATETVN